jgi:peptidoglycan hydrolase-like protein with peptidoglycan-binding domain
VLTRESLSPSVRAPVRYGRVLLFGLLGGLVVVALVVVAGVLLMRSHARVAADPVALARVQTPLGGGTIESVSATVAGGRAIPVGISGGRVWPKVALVPGESVSIVAVVRRPGWIAWLTGSTERVRLSFRTPGTLLRERYVTVSRHAPLRLSFASSVRKFAYALPGRPLHAEVLPAPASQIDLGRHSRAGSYDVAAAPRTWEKLVPTRFSWFPPGARATAVVSPAPGTRILPTTTITLTFSKPVRAALGRARPILSPAAPGHWHVIDSHTVEFRPRGYGFGLDSTVNLALPSTVRLVGDASHGPVARAAWTVPSGSPLRADQILAQLGYLPLTWHASGHRVRPSAAAQVDAAIRPPAGLFRWRFANDPASLEQLWQPGVADGVVTRGAVMAFENDHNMAADGVIGPAVWRALIKARIADQRSSFTGYSFVAVSIGSQSLDLWHDGRTVMTTAVNTGIAAAPTATGVYPVYEHIAVGTMSGTNPDGSTYVDPGIPWISYFNGGDALHGFIRASYGFPQSLGCVEMPPATAGEVWPYTPIGTLVDVA